MFCRSLLLVPWILAALVSPAAFAAPNAPGACRIIVVGYTGGTETPNYSMSGIVQIRDRLQGLNDAGLCAHTFSAYEWWHAYGWVRSQFGATGRGRMTPQEVAQGPKVVLYGHSLGGWATLWLARRLEGQGVSVELTVQMDSVGFTDKTVPANVKEAANYFEKDTFVLRGRDTICVGDSNKTQLLGNFQVPGVVHYNISRAPEISDLIVDKVQEIYDDP
ncbi:MAG: hypothetical protein WBF06_09845 [Candidatus Acidiferrales bacterium]